MATKQFDFNSQEEMKQLLKQNLKGTFYVKSIIILTSGKNKFRITFTTDPKPIPSKKNITSLELTNLIRKRFTKENHLKEI